MAVLAATLALLAVLTAQVLATAAGRSSPVAGPPGWASCCTPTCSASIFAVLSVLVLLAATAHEVLAGVRERAFPGLVLLLAGGLTGLFLTGDVFNFYVFFELAMTASYALTTYGGGRRQLRAALVFTAVNLLGSFIFLLSVAGTYRVTGALAMHDVAERMPGVDPNAAILVAAGFFIAFSVKLGLFPFHFWLPTVYAGSRPAVAAILSGAVANIGAYGLLRFGPGHVPRPAAARGHRARRARCGVAGVRRGTGGGPRGCRARRSPTPPSGRSGTSWSRSAWAVRSG